MASSSGHAEFMSKLGDHVVLKFEGCTNLIKVDMETTIIRDIKMRSLLGPKLELYYNRTKLGDPAKTLMDYNILSGSTLRGALPEKKMAVDIPVPDSSSEDSHKRLSNV